MRRTGRARSPDRRAPGKPGQVIVASSGAKTLDPVLLDLGDDDEIVLRDHGGSPAQAQALRKETGHAEAPVFRKSSEKSMSRFESQ